MNWPHYSTRSLREQIALVGQQVVLFDDTIARNIAYGALQRATDADIEAAAERPTQWNSSRRLPDG